MTEHQLLLTGNEFSSGLTLHRPRADDAVGFALGAAYAPETGLPEDMQLLVALIDSSRTPR